MPPTVNMPEFGLLGIPPELKDALRADFRTGEFERIIEQKGYRLLWSRASPCPCTPVNDQTKQPDPNCTLCKGASWFYFGPRGYVADTTKVGELTTAQKQLVTDTPGAIIKGIMTGLQTEFQPYTPIGHWLSGTSSVTVRPENRLGYYDRLIAIDSEIIYAESIDLEDPTVPLAVRYPIISVNLIRSFTKTYTDVEDFTLTAGKLVWKTGKAPEAGTRIVIHYNTFPFWIVVTHPKTVRDTVIKRKTRTPTTPTGNPKQLPIQAIVRYDFLPPPE